MSGSELDYFSISINVNMSTIYIKMFFLDFKIYVLWNHIAYLDIQDNYVFMLYMSLMYNT